MTMRSLILASLGLAALAVSPARAATEKMYSYTPADKPTAARTDSGLTFVFDKGLMSMKMKIILSTEAHAEADVEPVSDHELGVKLDKILPAGAVGRDLYAVEDKAQGTAMIKALCPGSSKGWLVFEPLRPRVGTVVQALGDDPITGHARFCTTLNFDFKGEWKVPEAVVQRSFGAISPVESKF
jgi:hypothetical protein